MNSTIIRKKKKCKTCQALTYIFSHGNCKECSTIVSTNKRVEKYQDELETESIQNLISDLDVVMSQYIRNKYADNKGIVGCFTCSKKLPIAEMTNGHYISRSHYGLRFLPENLRPQCYHCNGKHETDTEPFRQALERENKGITEYLERLAREVYKPTRDELKELLIEYRYKLNDIKKKYAK